MANKSEHALVMGDEGGGVIVDLTGDPNDPIGFFVAADSNLFPPGQAGIMVPIEDAIRIRDALTALIDEVAE